jgi:hypothetical protein
MLQQVDFGDGRVDEWEDFSEATVTTLHSAERFDPADFDFRMWLGWNATRQRIYLSLLAADDLYVRSDGLQPFDVLTFMVDGDHSGGPFQFSGDERVQNSVQAQQWSAPGTLAEGPVSFSCFCRARQGWEDRPPYADGGTGAMSENPTLWHVEFYFTPFDAWIWDDEESTVVSELEAGKVIGLFLGIADGDSQSSPWARFSIPEVSEDACCPSSNADAFGDALLLGAGGDLPDESAVRSDSWRR